MNNLYNNTLYLDDINYVSQLDLPWEKLKDKTIFISGATGLVGSFFIDVIMHRNLFGLNCRVYALCRKSDYFFSRFVKWYGDEKLIPIFQDVSMPLVFDQSISIDFVLHLASNTHPILYSTDPVGTILTNVIGTNNLLSLASIHHSERFIFASSNEIYGENRGDVELFGEDYCGYIDCNTLRAGYPESKRCGEALCQAYNSQKDLNFCVARLTRTYGATVRPNDSKVVNQFINNAVNHENIILKSKGNQFYSYIYVADAVGGLLYILMKGASCEAYNISDLRSDITLLDMAKILADASGVDVVHDIPDDIEAKGFSKATKARLDGEKIRGLGWEPRYSIKDGLLRTLKILSEL